MEIGGFATLVGLSILQLRRYDRLLLLEPEGALRSRLSLVEHRPRVISLPRSIDAPIADTRVLAGIADGERRQHGDVVDWGQPAHGGLASVAVVGAFGELTLTEAGSVCRSRAVWLP